MRFRTVVGLSLAVLAAGCGKDEVRVYEVAKETNSPAATAATEAQPAAAPRATAADGQSSGSPKVPWTIPPEWKERPNASGMRLASYGVTAADGRSVDISVTALGEQAGTELDNVNRWRGQLKLNPLTEDQLAMARDPVKIGGEPSHLYDIVSEELMLDGKYKSRILASILPTGQMTVFFKAIGEADLVAAEKVRFIGWLASVKTGAPASGSPTSSRGRGDGSITVETGVPAGNSSVGSARRSLVSTRKMRRGMMSTPEAVWTCGDTSTTM